MILNVLYPPIVNVSKVSVALLKREKRIKANQTLACFPNDVIKTHYSVMEGVELRIECLVDANPRATVVWKRIKTNSAVSGLSEPHILAFDRVTRDLDGERFECEARNEYGTSAPVLVVLDVLCESHIR